MLAGPGCWRAFNVGWPSMLAGLSPRCWRALDVGWPPMLAGL
jgi:hypothetical protein